MARTVTSSGSAGGRETGAASGEATCNAPGWARDAEGRVHAMFPNSVTAAARHAKTMVRFTIRHHTLAQAAVLAQAGGGACESRAPGKVTRCSALADVLSLMSERRANRVIVPSGTRDAGAHGLGATVLLGDSRPPDFVYSVAGNVSPLRREHTDPRPLGQNAALYRRASLGRGFVSG
jgi:hypothetical protein